MPEHHCETGNSSWVKVLFFLHFIYSASTFHQNNKLFKLDGIEKRYISLLVSCTWNRYSALETLTVKHDSRHIMVWEWSSLAEERWDIPPAAAPKLASGGKYTFLWMVLLSPDLNTNCKCGVWHVVHEWKPSSSKFCPTSQFRTLLCRLKSTKISILIPGSDTSQYKRHHKGVNTLANRCMQQSGVMLFRNNRTGFKTREMTFLFIFLSFICVCVCFISEQGAFVPKTEGRTKKKKKGIVFLGCLFHFPVWAYI